MSTFEPLAFSAISLRIHSAIDRSSLESFVQARELLRHQSVKGAHGIVPEDVNQMRSLASLCTQAAAHLIQMEAQRRDRPDEAYRTASLAAAFSKYSFDLAEALANTHRGAQSPSLAEASGPKTSNGRVKRLALSNS